MSPEELACWIADAPPMRLSRAGVRWQSLHDRALQAIRGTLERAAEVAYDTAHNGGDGEKIAAAIRQLKDQP